MPNENNETRDDYNDAIGVNWVCEHCGEPNIDFPELTAVPMCGGCSKDIGWWHILDDASNPRTEASDTAPH